MSVLSDREIIELIEKGDLDIDPFKQEHLTPNGYDLTVGSVFHHGREQSSGTAILHPGDWAAIATLEYVRIPSFLIGQMWLRSSWVRRGLITAFGIIDAGFEGNLTVTAYNSGEKDVELRIGDRYVQMILLRMSSAPIYTYEERSGAYQGQRGLNLG